VYSTLQSETCAKTEVLTWTASTVYSSPLWSLCGGYVITGGYNKLGTASTANGDYYYKSYSGLPAHNSIYFTITLWVIDSWSYDLTSGDYDDYFNIQFDGQTLTGFTWNVYNFYHDYCGNEYPDLPHVRIFGRVQHTGSTLTMRVVDMCDQNSGDESLAFREVNLLFSTATTTNTMCSRSLVPPRSGQCSCSEGQYDPGSGCVDCDASCASCFGAGSSSCYQCKVGYSWSGSACIQCWAGCAACHGTGQGDCDLCLTNFYLSDASYCVPECPELLNIATDASCRDTCKSPCTSNPTGLYVYWDGSCNSTCVTPLQSSTLIKTIPNCVYPCDPTDYLYWDGTCAGTCFEPLLASVYLGKNFCNYPCATSAEYLYWNGSCLASCLPPFKVVTRNGRMFCNFTCNEGAYLYWNGDCSADCLFPLSVRITDGNLYCDYPCEANQYLYWDGSCENSCASLLTPSTTGTVRPRNYCDYPGDSTTYLYWNSSLLSVCDPPFEVRVFKGMKYCENPCPTSYYIHWNISCMSTCPTPGVIRQQAGLLYCDFPCKENEFYYWDGTCGTSCPDPFAQAVTGGDSPRYICNFDCLAPNYHYWNGSCLDTCDPPFTTTSMHGRQFCHFPCDNDEFLFYNATCGKNCPLPFIPSQRQGIDYCGHPCLPGEFITEWNNTCLTSCDPPYRIENKPFGMDWCRLPCDDAEAFINETTTLCSATCDGTAEKIDDLYYICIPHPPPPPPQGLLDLLLTAVADPRDPSFISLNKLTYPIRYVKIYVPPRLEKLLESRARNIATWNIDISRPDKLVASFPVQPLPAAIYANGGLATSFILNFWSDLMILGVAILCGFLFQVLKKVFEIMEWEAMYAMFHKLSVISTWNFFLILLGYYADDIAFFGYLDYRYNHVDNLVGNTSMFVGLIVLSILLAYFCLMLYIALEARTIKKMVSRDQRADEEERFCKKWRWCLLFFQSFKDQDFPQQIFYLVYILRLVLVILVTALGYEYPLLQTSFQAGANLLILMYILIINPLKKTINTVQILCYEVGALTSNSSFWMLMLIDLNSTRFYNWAVIVYLGDIILIANVYLNVAAPIFLIVKGIIELHYIYLRWINDSELDRAAWVRLVTVLIQQGAFGFEEMLESAPRVVRTLKAPVSQRQIFPVENVNMSLNSPTPESRRFIVEQEEETTFEEQPSPPPRQFVPERAKSNDDDDPFVWKIYDTEETPEFDQTKEDSISGRRRYPEDYAETLSIPDNNNSSGFFGDTQSTFRGLYHLEGIMPVNKPAPKKNLESIAEEEVESPRMMRNDRKFYL